MKQVKFKDTNWMADETLDSTTC